MTIARNEQQVDCARRLLECLANKDSKGARKAISDLNEYRKQNILNELGKLTRQLHESLKAVAIKGVTEKIPDSKQRLLRVMEIMESAATKTIEQVEKTMPLSEALAHIAGHLLKSGEQFEQKKMSPEEFVEFYDSMMHFLTSVVDNAGTMHDNLQEVVVAQDYQDLTGQAILKVMEVVEDLESKLVSILQLTAEAFGFKDIKSVRKEAKADAEMEVVAEDPNPEVGDQDAVDDLLDELGF